MIFLDQMYLFIYLLSIIHLLLFIIYLMYLFWIKSISY